MRLSEIAKVQIGYQHRGHIERASEGTHRIIQPKDISELGTLDASDLYSFTPRNDPARYQVTRGDILFLSRGQRCFAVPITDHLADTVATYYFYILRLNPGKVEPEYLAWYINQPPAQRFLESRMRGSHMLMIPKASFEQLEIEIPVITTQRGIIELERLQRREESCLTKLIDARQRLVQGVSLKAVQNRKSIDRSNTNE
jgi:hypothetical protein